VLEVLFRFKTHHPDGLKRKISEVQVLLVDEPEIAVLFDCSFLDESFLIMFLWIGKLVQKLVPPTAIPSVRDDKLF